MAINQIAAGRIEVVQVAKVKVSEIIRDTLLKLEACEVPDRNEPRMAALRGSLVLALAELESSRLARESADSAELIPKLGKAGSI
jgi:hypothetical protein